MTDVSFFGQIRGNIRQYFGSAQQDVQPVLSEAGEQVVVQALPERTDIVKFGKSYGCAIPTGSAFTYVNAWPTTTSQLILANAEAAGGPCYSIERVWMSDISAGPTGPRAIVAQIIPVGATGPINVPYADNTAVLRWQYSGRNSNYGGNAKLLLNNTTAAIANKWTPLGVSPLVPAQPLSAALTIGLTIEAMVQGRILLPPGASLGLSGIAGAASGTAIIGVDWHEVYLNVA